MITFKQYTNLFESIQDIIAHQNELYKMTIPEIYNMGGDDVRGLYNFTPREKFVKNFSWSIPCKEAFDAIKKAIPLGSTIYDLLAGTGFWAKNLKNVGYNVQAFDLNKPKFNEYKHGKSFVHINRSNAVRKAHQFKIRNKPVNIILSWIPYESTIGEIILQKIPINSKVILIGEDRYGCTGTCETFDILHHNYKELAHADLPKFEGMHDDLWIYQKII